MILRRPSPWTLHDPFTAWPIHIYPYRSCCKLEYNTTVPRTIWLSCTLSRNNPRGLRSVDEKEERNRLMAFWNNINTIMHIHWSFERIEDAYLSVWLSVRQSVCLSGWLNFRFLVPKSSQFDRALCGRKSHNMHNISLLVSMKLRTKTSRNSFMANIANGNNDDMHSTYDIHVNPSVRPPTHSFFIKVCRIITIKRKGLL